MFNLVLFGPPGSGKGTQACKLVEKFNFVHLSTGDILRAEIRRKTPIGIEAQNLIDKGELVPDEVVIEMIRSCVSQQNHIKGFIFDGFPRTTRQAQELDKMLKEEGMEVDAMITLDVDEDIIINRILKRGESSGRADDQNPEIIKNRLKIYHDQTAIVARHYKLQNKLICIDNMGTVEETFEKICCHIPTA